jgi:hypothetical protein
MEVSDKNDRSRNENFGTSVETKPKHTFKDCEIRSYVDFKIYETDDSADFFLNCSAEWAATF